jgi:hypothetical protein
MIYDFLLENCIPKISKLTTMVCSGYLMKNDVIGVFWMYLIGIMQTMTSMDQDNASCI